jgi:hypothetical protein
MVGPLFLPGGPGSVDRLAHAARTAEPLAGGLRVTAVDGRSGAGKTTLAARLAALVPGAVTVHLEDLYPGWDGLRAGVELLVGGVLEPFVRGEPPQAPTWDWARDEQGPPLARPRTDHLIVEGVGCGSPAARPFLTLLVWVRAPAAVRRSRALARDPGFADHWELWARQEDRLYAAAGTARAAGIVLDAGSPAAEHGRTRRNE